MWTDATRALHARAGLALPSDLTDASGLGGRRAPGGRDNEGGHPKEGSDHLHPAGAPKRK